MNNTNCDRETWAPFIPLHNAVTLFKSNVCDRESNNVCHSNYFECSTLKLDIKSLFWIEQIWSWASENSIPFSTDIPFNVM
jgi:hypothetical protein